MNTLMNINPWSILDELFDANSRTFRNMQARVAGRFPPVNVYLDDHAVMVDVELPGRTAKDVSLSLEPQAVVIAVPRGRRQGERKIRKRNPAHRSAEGRRAGRAPHRDCGLRRMTDRKLNTGRSIRHERT